MTGDGGAATAPPVDLAEIQTWLDLAVRPRRVAGWHLDVASGDLSWSAGAASLFADSPDGAPGTWARFVRAVDHEDATPVSSLLHRLTDHETAELALHAGDRNGQRQVCVRAQVLERDSEGRPARVLGLLVDDVGPASLQEQLEHLISQDALTGIPNRRALDDAVRREWRVARRTREPVSVALVDVDHFGIFNLLMGSAVGDEALRAVARTLTRAVHREGDLVTRFDGDRFAVLLPRVDAEGALTVARRMAERVRAVTMRRAGQRRLTISAGIATWDPQAGLISADTVVAQAERALRAAKASGRDTVVSYGDYLAEDDAVEAAIRTGLVHGEFELFYQPLLNLGCGSLAGFEALARWRRPGEGLLAPDRFIPVAEASDLVCDLGRWALVEAGTQLARWSEQDPALHDCQVTVNLSARHVNLPGVVDDVQRCLRASGLSPDRLGVEVTETALVQGTQAGAHLARLRELGVGVAIDDFGTGYTSVGQIPSLPADVLKIDRTFVASVDARKRELVKLMIGAARAFRMRVLAEGVEDAAALAVLGDLGCDQVQGYAVARPMPAEDIPAWVVRYRRDPYLPPRL